MRELGLDYSGRHAAHLAEALFFTACWFHEWAQLTGDRLVRDGAAYGFAQAVEARKLFLVWLSGLG
jgi:hypothetical protein